VLGDLIEVASNLRSGVRPRSTQRDEVTIRPIDDLMTQYYVTLDVADRPGVLAAVAAAFGAHSVSIRSMEQVGLGAEARLVFITHVAREADLQATLAELGRLDAVERIGGLLRVIGADQ
jgi:homoserine dehydrogenase